MRCSRRSACGLGGGLCRCSSRCSSGCSCPRCATVCCARSSLRVCVGVSVCVWPGRWRSCCGWCGRFGLTRLLGPGGGRMVGLVRSGRATPLARSLELHLSRWASSCSCCSGWVWSSRRVSSDGSRNTRRRLVALSRCAPPSWRRARPVLRASRVLRVRQVHHRAGPTPRTGGERRELAAGVGELRGVRRGWPVADRRAARPCPEGEVAGRSACA